MSELDTLRVIARIHSDFPTKFGIPRQSCLVPELKGEILFEPGFQNPEAVRGLEEFSHIWLIWKFSQSAGREWSPTVRPPRLGGNRRMGVFATRSPFRPNFLGLSCVGLEKVEFRKDSGPVLHVSGADLMDGTPIYDIKPYLPYADAYPDAKGGFAARPDSTLDVMFPPELLARVPEHLRAALVDTLAQDPRPHYHHDPHRVYGFRFAGLEVGFTVTGHILTVCRCEAVC